jgi:hypothetical protein
MSRHHSRPAESLDGAVAWRLRLQA